MQPEVQRQLLDINRAFYERLARPFADSRSTGQPGLRQVLATIEDGDMVLDVGCADGRVARALDEMGRSAEYLGVDASAALLVLGQQRAASLSHIRAGFAQTDLADTGWEAVLPERSFTVVLCLQVLHHLPDSALRQRVVRQMAAHLAPGGRLIVSTWQFLNAERLRKKVVPWASVGLEDNQVESGDFLLDWQRGAYGLRYVHLASADELRLLFTGAGLVVSDVFLADAGLNLYAAGKLLAKAGKNML